MANDFTARVAGISVELGMSVQNKSGIWCKPRCKQEAQWLIDNPKDSIRKVAKEFCISKSQLHRDLHELRNINDDLYVQCRNILRRHKRRCL